MLFGFQDGCPQPFHLDGVHVVLLCEHVGSGHTLVAEGVDIFSPSKFEVVELLLLVYIIPIFGLKKWHPVVINDIFFGSRTMRALAMLP